MPDAFVSYASEDRSTAGSVCSTLEAADLDCWMTPRDIAPGATWAQAIIAAIRSSSSMVVVFSSHANESSHVMREVDRAAAHRVPLLPFRIEDCEPSEAMAYYLSLYQWLDAFPEAGEAHLSALVEAVRRITASVPEIEAQAAEVLLQAAAAHDAAAATTLGLQAKERGEIGDAERWFHAGAEGGDVMAATNLGLLARERADLAEAEQWLRVGAEGGDVLAATNLGLVARDLGHPDDARHWLEVGARGGDQLAAAELDRAG